MDEFYFACRQTSKIPDPLTPMKLRWHQIQSFFNILLTTT